MTEDRWGTRTRPAPLWVLDLLCDEVERVPAGVGVEGRVEGQRYVSWVQFGALERVVKVLGVTWEGVGNTHSGRNGTLLE